MLHKPVFRDQIRRYLGEEMLAGRLTHGQRVPLAEIARALDVSVTPVREALSQLEHAGIVTSIPNRGFFIGELSVEEAHEVYPIIASLEAMLVESTTYSVGQIAKLGRLRHRFERARRAADAVRADLAFHDALTAPNANQTAKRIVGELKIRIFFYELAFWRRGDLSSDSKAQHRLIVTSIENGDTKRAARQVHHNWIHGLGLVRQGLRNKAALHG